MSAAAAAAAAPNTAFLFAAPSITSGLAPSAMSIAGRPVFSVVQASTVPAQPRPNEIAGPRVSRMRHRRRTGAL